MTVHTLPDIVGPVTANPITTDTTKTAKWIMLSAIGVSGAVVCGVGDTADASHGAHIGPINQPTLYPPNPTDATDVYQLYRMQAYVPTGCTLTITYGS